MKDLKMYLPSLKFVVMTLIVLMAIPALFRYVLPANNSVVLYIKSLLGYTTV
jgi:hypothetical protein